MSVAYYSVAAYALYQTVQVDLGRTEYSSEQGLPTGYRMVEYNLTIAQANETNTNIASECGH